MPQDDPGLPDPDRVLASAAQYLIEGGEYDAANMLLSCTLEIPRASSDHWNEGWWQLSLLLHGPRIVYEAIEDRGTLHDSIRAALRAVLPWGCTLESLSAQATLIELSDEWRKELTDIARGRTVHNQGTIRESDKARIVHGLRYRSQTEVKIADALDQKGIFFLPNCLGRLTAMSGARVNREPDFLICQDGHWGILEVDGEPYHPATRTVQDHERDRLFHHHGIRLVQHYDATRCYGDPLGVVDEFLTLLARAYTP